MNEWTSRTESLLGGEAVKRLSEATVALFGLGGVGSYTAEALCRAGIGELWLWDGDIVAESNLNRQLIATRDTLGLPKTEAAARRLHSINPDCRLMLHQQFVTPEIAAAIDFSGAAYVVDAIDNVTAKLAIIERATEQGVPVISCMGTGNKLDPTALEVTDIAKTTVCPLARVMRRELRVRGIDHLRVVYSREIPAKTDGGRTPASVPFVPGTAGLILAGEIVRAIARGEG